MLFVVGFNLRLGDGFGIFIFGHCQGDELLRNGTNFLCARFGGHELAVPKECSYHVAKHCVTLVGGFIKLTVRHIISSY